MLLLTLFACKEVVEAPTDLDGLIKFTWSAFDGTAEELDQAITNLQEAADWENLTEVQDGTVSDLTPEDMALVGMEDKDVEAAAGVYMFNALSCDFEQLEEILLYAHQDELFDIYNEYERTFVGDEDAYRNGSAESVDWQVDYNSNVLLAAYDTSLNEAIRRVTTETWGDVIMVRRAMPEPCVFEDSSYIFDQDYTMRTFWQRSPGEIVHLYGMWREVDIGGGLNADNEGIQRQLLDALKELDDAAEQHCADGVP
jgi:hypothetical protein